MQVLHTFAYVGGRLRWLTGERLERLCKEHRGDAVTFVGTSQNDEAETREFFAEYGVTFVTVTDADGYPVSNQYGLTTVPTTLLIHPSGKVSVNSVGFSKADLEKIAKELGNYSKKQPASVFLPSEIVPDYEPG